MINNIKIKQTEFIFGLILFLGRMVTGIELLELIFFIDELGY